MKHALRSLLRTPGFTAIALLTLALGIGLNAAMFNIVNSLVFQPLKFPDATQLFRLVRTQNDQALFGHRPAHFVEIARASASFAQVACFRPWSFTLAEPDRPAEVLGSLRASPGYFNVLGLNMELGRDFLPEEDTPGNNHVVILSHKFWQSRFEADPEILGRTLRLDGLPHEIVGVAPALAADPRTLNSPEIYRPLALTEEQIADPVDHAYTIIGRYRPGVSPTEAATQLSAIAADLAVIDPTDYDGRELRAVSLIPEFRGTGRQIVLILIGLSGFVLLIACANLANLLLARTIARAREFSIRGALGASLRQLLQPLVTECTLLALVGGGLGVLVSLWTNDWMSRQFQAAGTDLSFVLDWRLLLFAFAASLFTALFFGIAPAWLIARVRLNDALKSGSRGSTGNPSQNRFRQVLIAGQFALALVLLSGGVFFARGLDQWLQRDAGWNPAPLLRGILSLPATSYPDPARTTRFFEQVQARVSALPGVAAAAISYEVPAFNFPSGRSFIVEGQPRPTPGNEIRSPLNGVTPDYFNTVGTRLLQGREFNAADRADSPPVIIINETMARALFPDQDAVGRRLAYADLEVPVWMEIVGIAADVRFLNVDSASVPFQGYIPLAHAPWSYVALSVRGAVAPAALIDPIRRAVSELDPDMAIKDFAPTTSFIQSGTQDLKAINHLLLGFALLGLFLAALGIYGVIARLVAQRTNEIGIRMALGAQLRDIVRLIVGASLRMVLAGAALGLLGAIWLARFLATAMPGITSNSTFAIGGATLVLIAVALLATWLPARRATKIDPMIALRSE